MGVYMNKTYGDWHDEENEVVEIKAELNGWTIVGVGKTKTYATDKHKGMVEGGLTLLLKKDDQLKKVILGYTELGEWLEDTEIILK